jgi:hypothetical protein
MQERAGQQKTTKFLNVCIKEANFALKISNLGLLKTLKGKKNTETIRDFGIHRKWVESCLWLINSKNLRK